MMSTSSCQPSALPDVPNNVVNASVLAFNPGTSVVFNCGNYVRSMPPDEDGNTEFLSAIDLCCRYVIWVPLKSKSVKDVLPAIWQHLLLRVGSGVSLLADKDSSITVELADSLFRMYHVRVHFISERNSRNNGCVERFMRTYTDHFSKAKVEAALEDRTWGQWGHQLTAVYNALYHPEVGNAPYTLLHNREYSVSTAHQTLAAVHAAQKPTSGFSMEQWLVQIRARHDAALRVVKARFVTRRRFAELELALSGEVPHFEPHDLVLLRLGDSNGGFMIKNRCHSGPFDVVRRPSTTQYFIAGGDGVPVLVHGYRLLEYTPTLADVLGNSGLAASAVGAAQARLLYFEANDPALE